PLGRRRRNRGVAEMRWILLFGVSGMLLAAAPETTDAQRLSDQKSGKEDRRELEKQFRRRFGELIKERLNLSDVQMSRLEGTNRRFETRRRSLFVEERQVREEMRDALAGEDN